MMDYGKYCFEQNKKNHAAKKKQKQIHAQGSEVPPGTDEGDYQVKLRNLVRFLTGGDKAKVTLRFRGREMAHRDLGCQASGRVRDDLAETRPGGAVPEDGRAADDHGHCAEEEVSSDRLNP